MEIRDKILTIEDVELLNAEPNSIVILKNTIGQTSEIIEKLGDNVRIQVIGGYDSANKKKYAERRIEARTYYTPKQLSLILSKFEEYEAMIDPSWSNLEKAVFVYKQLAQNIVYNDDNEIECRNLNAVMGKGVCAGYAITFKEMMDRLGIEAEVINQPRVHTWNAIKIDGMWYPIDLTWDADNIQKKGEKNLLWFGLNPNFNKYKSHEAMGENIVADNCFDPKDISDALNRVNSTDEYMPVEINDNFKEIYEAAVSNAKQSDSLETIIDNVISVAENALKLQDVYNQTAYINEYDGAFFELFESIKSNPNLTDEQKTLGLTIVHNSWADVMGCVTYGHMQERIKSDLGAALKKMERLYVGEGVKPTYDGFVENQLNAIYNECTSYGVVDITKLQEIYRELQVQIMEFEKGRQEETSETKPNSIIKFDRSVAITEVSSAKDFDINKWAKGQIASYEAFINGVEESGVDLNDPETREILNACKYTLGCLYSNLHLDNNTEVCVEIKWY